MEHITQRNAIAIAQLRAELQNLQSGDGSAIDIAPQQPRDGGGGGLGRRRLLRAVFVLCLLLVGAHHLHASGAPRRGRATSDHAEMDQPPLLHGDVNTVSGSKTTVTDTGGTLLSSNRASDVVRVANLHAGSASVSSCVGASDSTNAVTQPRGDRSSEAAPPAARRVDTGSAAGAGAGASDSDSDSEVTVHVYPNPALEAAWRSVEARRLHVCTGRRLRTPRGSIVYGEFIGDTMAEEARQGRLSGANHSWMEPFADFLYDSGENCELPALYHALRLGAYTAATPREADVFLYFTTGDFYAFPTANYTDEDRRWLRSNSNEDHSYIPAALRLKMRRSCAFFWGLDWPKARALMPLLDRTNYRRHFVLTLAGGFGHGAHDGGLATKLADLRNGPCGHEGQVSPPLQPRWLRPPPVVAQLLAHTLETDSTPPPDSTRPNILSIPFVGPVHVSPPSAAAAAAAAAGGDGGGGGPVPPWNIAHARTHTISYVGSTKGSPPNARLRTLLKKACAAEKACFVGRPRGTVENLKVKFRSTFCLEPGGYGGLRKSMVDSILMGCIPVFFMRRLECEHLWPFHWGRADWYNTSAVNIDFERRTAKGGGGESADSAVWVLELLKAIPARRVRAMQASLAAHAPAFSYGAGGRVPGDAVDRTLRGLRALGRARAANDRAHPKFAAWSAAGQPVPELLRAVACLRNDPGAYEAVKALTPLKKSSISSLSTPAHSPKRAGASSWKGAVCGWHSSAALVDLWPSKMRPACQTRICEHTAQQ